jgi:hypothetical protein
MAYIVDTGRELSIRNASEIGVILLLVLRSLFFLFFLHP